MSTSLDTYSQRLILALRLKNVPGPRIAEALAEVESHVTETGEDATEAFGAPRVYAAQLAKALGIPGSDAKAGRLRAFGWRDVVFGLGIFLVSGGGAQLLLTGVSALRAGETGPFGLPALASIVLGAVLIGAWGVALVIFMRRNSDPLLDPRTGAEMTPPFLRSVIALLVGTPAAVLAIGILVLWLAPLRHTP